MKTVLLIWAIVQAVLIIIGWSFVLICRNNAEKKKLGYLLCAVGNTMMAAFFIYLWIAK